jgi:hypothetical protein
VSGTLGGQFNSSIRSDGCLLTPFACGRELCESYYATMSKARTDGPKVKEIYKGSIVNKKRYWR